MIEIKVVQSAEAIDIAADGGFLAHLPICRCRREPSTVYESAGDAGFTRLNLARCPLAGLHLRQVDELLARLVAAFGGKRHAEVIRRAAARPPRPSGFCP